MLPREGSPLLAGPGLRCERITAQPFVSRSSASIGEAWIEDRPAVSETEKPGPPDPPFELRSTDSTPLLPRASRFPDAGWGASEAALSVGMPDARAPESIGPYRVLRRLGSGGMGEVFLVHDEALGRQIALKRVRPDRSAAEIRQRFEVEARVTALLQHPSILPVYHLDAESEDAFYTMRPVEGQTLAQLLAELTEHPELRREWPVARLLRLFLQVSNAVAYAHSRGVVHRDLKPSNIMTGDFEEVLVLDWGMAKIRRDPLRSQQLGDQRLGVEWNDEEAQTVPLDDLQGIREETASQVLVGTPGYMAPEQLDGKPADERSDVFALGVILYELLTLRLPWPVSRVGELKSAMAEPPVNPALAARGRTISTDLAHAALTALAHAPEERYASVAEFAADVAHALEGRATWRTEEATHDRDRWRIEQGRLRNASGNLSVHSRGVGRSFRYFCTDRFGEGVCLEAEIQAQGRCQLSIWLSSTSAREHRPVDGYCIDVMPGRRHTLSIERSGRVVSGSRSPEFERKRWYRVVAIRENDHISLQIDDREVYTYRDPVPLPGGFVGLTGQGSDIWLRNVRVSSLGTSATVSCLSVPDSFFHRGLYEEARAEYEAIASSLPGRSEGRVARFREGLCLIEMARLEKEPELRSLMLGEARTSYEQGMASNRSCLLPLGLAIVADESGDPVSVHESLERALARDTHDPHLAIVHEWLLSRLHDVDPEERFTVAELVPLAIRHCLRGWGRRSIQDLMRKVRQNWETPSFLSGRSRLRESDLATHADAAFFLGFWAGRATDIADTLERLLGHGEARPHHVADAYFALHELGEHEAAHRLMTELKDGPQGPGSPTRWATVFACCRATDAALAGDLGEAEGLLGAIRTELSHRPYNSARLWLARAAWEHGRRDILKRTLRPRGTRDSFAREHAAWFALLDKDARSAARHLRPFVERGHHLSGRNLSNFLYGALQLLRGDPKAAEVTFRSLPEARWPRSWTLGSYLAAGRLGAGCVDDYLDQAFPWEKRVLAAHRSLLEAVGTGEPLPDM